MLSRAPARRKAGDSHFDTAAGAPVDRQGAGVNSVTPQVEPGTGPDAAQWWMNCIWVPASSITSPLRSGTESPASGTPLTLGRAAPSTCENA